MFGKGAFPFGGNLWTRRSVFEKGYRYDERIGPMPNYRICAQYPLARCHVDPAERMRKTLRAVRGMAYNGCCMRSPRIDGRDGRERSPRNRSRLRTPSADSDTFQMDEGGSRGIIQHAGAGLSDNEDDRE